ncbi:GGDEF domain-containing phosphodiesterase [Acetobacterium bakii]|nr:GGDEF domain-containing phosphodiesterase [Acetobacterium bakii]
MGENLFNKIKGKVLVKADWEKSFQLLKENQNYVQHLAKIGSWTHDLKEDYVYISDEAYHILGTTYQEFHANLENYYYYVHPEDLKRVKTASKGLTEGKEYDLEYRVVTKEGNIRFVHEKTKALYDEKNQPIKMIGILEDITNEKIQDENLKAREEKYNHGRQKSHNTAEKKSIKKAVEMKINDSATHDEMTGLPNRAYFKQELSASCQTVRENDSLLAVIMLDFDGLKYINAALGFKSGEQMIIQMMIRLKAFLGNENFISRYSEDQFGIIARNSNSQEDYEDMAKSIVDLFSRAFKVDIYEFDVTINMGISIFSKHYQAYSKPEDERTDEEKDRESLIKHANIALLWAKKDGKNCYQFYSSDISIQNYKQFELRTDLRKAIEKKQFEVYYQPVVKLKTTEIIAAEALIRWNHPNWGLVSPGEFIYLAEETGVIIEMGKWMLREVCRHHKKWLKNGFSEISVTLNFSGIQFYEKNFVENIKSILDEFELDPKFLIMELSERLLTEEGDKTIHDIQRLESYGIKVALDDVGTGFASLVCLNTVRIDVLKMDGAFIKNILTDKTTAIIAQTIVNLARDLKIKLVAVGIENWEQLSFLREINCYAGQGYLYSRPLPLEAFEKILKKGKCKPTLINNTVFKPRAERREFFRLAFHQLLKADLMILKIKDKNMNVGNTKILIKNIGPGGLCFISNIKFPLEREFTLQFRTTLLGVDIKAYGSPVWIDETEDGFYEYGIKFSIDENEREELMKTLYAIQIKMKKNILFEDGNFTSDIPFVYFKSMTAR